MPLRLSLVQCSICNNAMTLHEDGICQGCRSYKRSQRKQDRPYDQQRRDAAEEREYRASLELEQGGQLS